MRRHVIPLALLLSLLILGGCAGLFLKPPTVTLADLQIIEAGLFEQRFMFKLRVQNPNDVEIPITGLNFAVELNDQPFATGVSNKPITVPRLDEKILEVTAVSNLSGILRQVTELIQGKNKAITYRIKGRLLAGSFGEITFDETGKWELPKPPVKLQ